MDGLKGFTERGVPVRLKNQHCLARTAYIGIEGAGTAYA